MKQKLRKIKSLLSTIRKGFEYIEIQEGFDGGKLGGYCLRAAVQVFLFCKKENITVEMIVSNEHAFNKIDDYIIDITATQFGNFPKINIKKYKNKPSIYVGGNSYNSIKDIKHLIRKREVDKDFKVIDYFLKDR